MLCLNNYAYYLAQDNRELDKAAAMSLKTIEAEPDNVTYLDTYAWIMFVSKNYGLARTYIDKTIKLAEKTAENASLLSMPAIFTPNSDRQAARLNTGARRFS